uniref:PARP-type domain-containing protein n=1 Tax=Panagrolaimus davidi TaxID=227884 RepID=A0A914PUW8_9BILA
MTDNYILFQNASKRGDCNACQKIIPAGHLEVVYQNNEFHPECISKTGKVNCDSNEIDGYDSLSDDKKKLLDELFKKSHDFDIPSIEKAKRSDNCALADCPAENGRPSYISYTIRKGDLQIKFHGDIYHPKCFKSSHKVNMDIKDFLGYDSLRRRTKLLLEKNLEDIDESESGDVDGPTAKKSKMEPQMQDENVSNDNIQNEFDDGQEPFDGTNVKEEMSDPIILQMNTLNELNNTQTVNDREEREGNQESGILVVENVVSGNVMEDIKEIPEIKKEVKGEPEILTLDDDEVENAVHVETNEVQPEIKQESVAESYNFDVPTGDFLRSTLGKFDIELTNEVYTFYGNL